MAMVIDDNKKKFEKPDTGEYIGVIADMVDLGKMKTKFGEKVKIRIVWLLNVSDTEGFPFRVAQQVTASMHEKATLYGIVKAVLAEPPPVPYDVEKLIGMSRRLYVVKEKAPDNEMYSNIKAILPLGTATPMVIPAGFVRSKDKPKSQTFQSSAPAAPTSTPAPARPTEETASQASF